LRVSLCLAALRVRTREADGPSPPRGRGGGHTGRDLPPAAAAVV